MYERALKIRDVPVLTAITKSHLVWIYKTAFTKQFFDNWNPRTMISAGPADPLAVVELVKGLGIWTVFVSSVVTWPMRLHRLLNA